MTDYLKLSHNWRTITSGINRCREQLSAREHKLTLVDRMILIEMSDANRAISKRQLAHRCCCEQQSLTRSLSRLAKLGLITKIQDPDDRRSQLLSLSDPKAPLLKEQIAVNQQLWLRFLDPLTEEERELFSQLCSKIATGLDSAEMADPDKIEALSRGPETMKK
ncbi:MarR family winged helix-turn-helix transcriptional regulator [Dongshaea marina]|uniref:MarR family winged helix-turn-helix transcriptional regulator n=1 Tax=Dongshaea marina TaxID=2047966 RepID=UPI001F426F15|nr:MarR family transcriptional regulator [Dongshaea marina]